MTNLDAQNRRAIFNVKFKDFDPSEMEDMVDHVMVGVLPALFGDEMAYQILIDAFVKLDVDFGDDALVTFTRHEKSKLATYDLMKALNAYAYYGIVDREVTTYLTDQILLDGSDLSIATTLVDRFGNWFEPESSKTHPSFSGFGETEIVAALRAARARLAIDNNESGAVINPVGLAALVSMRLKSIQNLMAPDQPLHTGSKGEGIPVTQVRSWLKTRKSFLWSLVDISEPETTAEPGESPTIILQDVHFVPVDAGGNWFSPEHRKDGFFIVGDREQEQKFEEFLEALEVLSLMEVPIWRSPTSKGRWTVTAGLGWARKTSAELGL